MTAVAGALGSVIGYVGAEVAEVTIFEHLLWPQRFYNDLSPLTAATNVFLQPMGGPLHRAALEALDRFRDNGLYRGSTRGNMLGSAFFQEQHGGVAYLNRSQAAVAQGEKRVRNGFWFEVLRLVDQGKLPAEATTQPLMTSTTDVEGHAAPVIHRAVVFIFRLELAAVSRASPSTRETHPEDVDISEERITVQTVAALITTELSAVGAAIAAAVWLKTYWLTAFFCVPLGLKLLSLMVTVRREDASIQAPEPTREQPGSRRQDNSPTPKAESSPRPPPPTPELFEIISPSLGFALISGQPAHVLPFFRHYGHPIRTSPADRARELSCILLVYAFVLYFPAGLLSLLWMSPKAQYLWLAYQVYAIIGMHVSRLFGIGHFGRTEKKAAAVLQRGRRVRLWTGGVGVEARLGVEEAGSYAEGRRRVDQIVKAQLEEHT